MQDESTYSKASVRRLLTRSCARAERTSDDRYERFFQSLLGLYPTDAVELAAELSVDGVEELVERRRTQRPPGRMANPPVGHILDAEWFFTVGSRKRVAETLGNGPGRRALLLGCPSLVEPILERGLSVTLVDSSEHGVQQFVRATHQPGELTIEKRRIGQDDTESLQPDFDVAVLDPPWYLPAYAAFLRHAFRRTKPTATIHLSLLQRFTRPQAPIDRWKISRVASTMGRVSIARGALQYLTPSFEIASLRAAGLPGLENWRSADLLTLHRNQTETLNDALLQKCIAGMPPGEEWAEVYVAGQWVKYRACRNSIDPTAESFLQPANRDGYQLRTVSMRRLSSHRPDIWSSTNRTAISANPLLVGRALEELALKEGNTSRSTPVLDSLDFDSEFAELGHFLYDKA